MSGIELERDKRLYVTNHRFEEAWFNFCGDYYHVSTPLTKKQVEKLIVALQNAIAPPSYITRQTTSSDPEQRWSAVREEHQTEDDPRGFGRTRELAIEDLEEKIDQS